MSGDFEKAKSPRLVNAVIEDMRPHLAAVLALMEEAMDGGFIVNFSINQDGETKKATLTGLTVSKSYL